AAPPARTQRGVRQAGATHRPAPTRHAERDNIPGWWPAERACTARTCREKKRTRRYETANALSRDLQRYLADELVEARPPSTGYRLKKFVRRHKGQVIAASLVVAALLAGVVGTSLGLIEARDQEGVAGAAQREESAARRREAERADAEAQERQRAEASESVARRQWYVANINRAQADWDTGALAQLRSLLAATEGHPDRGFEWFYWQGKCHEEVA